MERINVMVSDKAKAIILEYQRAKNLTKQDEAVDRFIIEAVS